MKSSWFNGFRQLSERTVFSGGRLEDKARDPFRFCGLTPGLAKTTLFSPDLRADTGNGASTGTPSRREDVNLR